MNGLRAQVPVSERVEAQLPELTETYQYLHAHPELSFYEKDTARYLAEKLRALGFEVTEQVGDYQVPGRISYGVTGVLKNGAGPTVMVRTDLDGLPVREETGVPYASQVTTRNEQGEEVAVMHACGHDIHMTSFLGTAAVLASARDRWQGTLILIGQPAEERGSGARAMLQDGLYRRFPRPDFVLALHVDAGRVAGRIGLGAGYAMASVNSVDLTVRGLGGHGAYPHTTKDPIVLAAEIVLGLQTIVSREISPLDSAVVTVGSIHGGTKHNIIPDDVHLQITVRSYKAEVRRLILDSIRRIAGGMAAAAGIPEERHPIVQVDEDEFTPALYNDPELTRRLTDVFRRVLGEENVEPAEPVMGGEDFSRYSLRDSPGETEVPTLLFWLGAVDPEKFQEYRQQGRSLPSLHSSEFAPLPEPTIRNGVIAMSEAVLELMGRPPSQ